MSTAAPAQPDFTIEDPLQLTAYLRARGALRPGEPLTDFEVLPGGVSNRAVRVALSGDRQWVLKQCLAKLRVAVDWYSSPERLHREAQALQALPALTPPGTIPALIFEDRDRHVLAMEAVRQPHRNWKAMLLSGQVDMPLVRQFAQILAGIHGASHHRLAEYETDFGDRSFFETLRLEAYYAYAASQVALAAPFLTQLIADTRAQHLALVHGDYSPKNVLVRDGHLILLDHEVMHIGDPAFDVGFALTHLLSKARHVPQARPSFEAAAWLFWAEYHGACHAPFAGARAYEARAVRHTLACLLARVDGRSPLEYLTEGERQAQRQAVLTLIAALPTSMAELFDRYWVEMQGHAHADD